MIATAAAGALVLGVGAAYTLGRSSGPAPSSRSDGTHERHVVTPATADVTPSTSAPAALAATPATDQPATFTVTVGGSTLQLEVAASAPCWVSAGDASRGIVAYSGVVEASQPLRLQVAAPTSLRLGAPWNAQVTVNGQRVAMPSASGPINLRFELGGSPPPSPSGGTARASGATPT